MSHEFKVGDQVLVYPAGLGTEYLTKVTKVTKVHIVVEGGTKFNAKTLRRAGSSGFSSVYLRAPTEGDISRLRFEHKRKKARFLLTREFVDGLQEAELDRLLSVIRELSKGTTEG